MIQVVMYVLLSIATHQWLEVVNFNACSDFSTELNILGSNPAFS
jgi:hypothetical protein